VGQALVLSMAALLAVLILDQSPSAAGALVATLLFAGALALSLVPIGRRTAEEWAPIAISFAGRRAFGAARFRSRAPTRGAVATTFARGVPR
jgi:hypothetical protein